jgi:hypothetical protein
MRCTIRHNALRITDALLWASVWQGVRTQAGGGAPGLR